jgi:hypothetical protein
MSSQTSDDVTYVSLDLDLDCHGWQCGGQNVDFSMPGIRGSRNFWFQHGVNVSKSKR